jgi:hypothetical protein
MMYQVELDYVLRFVPPMSEHSGGLVLTRTLELPFPPYKKLYLFAKDLDDCPYPPGLRLDEVTWDIDRECFLATTELIVHGPIADIPWLLSSYLERGWQVGSLMGQYETDDDLDEEPADEVDVPEGTDDWDMDALEALEKESPRRRPKALNQLVKALVRVMVENGDDMAAAYALDRTGLVISLRDAEHGREPHDRVWLEAYREFEDLDNDSYKKWRRKVCRYRRIDKIEPFGIW